MRALLLIAATALVNCAPSESFFCPPDSTARTTNNVLSCFRGDDTMVGPFLSFPESGVLEDIGWFREGEEVGSWVSFDSEGLLVTERRILNGGRQIARHWFPDGTPKIYAEWQGEALHGWFRTWHPNGHPKSEGQHTDMERVGVWKFWEPDGSLRVTVTYEGGIEVGRTPGPE